ncbi:hypothetical protein DRF59_04180 [Chryseobacterium flavum]|uniref:Uncharacterized protein n=1 Tax=Chryseobacterium flavum TaxID=415851 RepID=A0A3D9CRK5_9FLAO|nr:hypothetical protein DRF59_04180 [Chryseobacterium flavum]
MKLIAKNEQRLIKKGITKVFLCRFYSFIFNRIISDFLLFILIILFNDPGQKEQIAADHEISYI